MTDKKLTDEEIIKALTELSRYTGFQKKYTQVLNATPDLIKRQKAENDSANAKIEICAEVIERKDAEIKMLKKCPKCVYEYDCEITEYCVQGPCSNFKTVEQIKAEAYKEFAERIRECCNSNNELSADAWLSVTTDINCVLKEMVGEEE